MLNRFFRLRHHTIICSHDQHHNVSSLRATRSHRGEGSVTWCIQKSDGAIVGFDIVGTNVLRDTPTLARGHFGTTNVIKQRGFSVIHVPHHRDNRWP